MIFHIPKNQFVTVLLGGWLISSAIVGCIDSKPPTSSDVSTPTPAVEESPTLTASPSVSDRASQQWTAILKGESGRGLTFSLDGKLLYEDKILLANIPVSYVSSGETVYAQRLIISNTSPSGRFNIVKACEETSNESGLCWSVFLVDRQLQTAEKVSIAKYGGEDWVQWTADERYALLAESMEGITFFVALDLQTGEAKLFDQTSATADLNSFTWIDDRTFQANILCGDRPNCTALPFRGNITTLFAQ